MKKSKRLERHFKGAANHHRIDILLLLMNKPDMNLESISDSLKANLKTISQHCRELHRAGLLDKKYRGRNVLHKLSPYGQRFSKFIKSFK